MVVLHPRALFTPAAVRKARGIPTLILGRLLGASASEHTFAQAPPVIGNSVPKSGTHLLLQILRALPGVRYFNGFIASAPPRPHVERPSSQQIAMLNRIAPGEVVPGHLFYNEAVQARLRARHFVQFFIFRDPRDVANSEAHYLLSDALHHSLHPEFAAAGSHEERLALAIRGIDPNRRDVYYPNIAARFDRYKAWISQPDVFSVRYEDLRGPELPHLVERIVLHYREKTNRDFDMGQASMRALEAIIPKRSHTFRSGELQQWKTSFSPRNKVLFNEIAGPLLIELGYETELNW